MCHMSSKGMMKMTLSGLDAYLMTRQARKHSECSMQKSLRPHHVNKHDGIIFQCNSKPDMLQMSWMQYAPG